MQLRLVCCYPRRACARSNEAEVEIDPAEVGFEEATARLFNWALLVHVHHPGHPLALWVDNVLVGTHPISQGSCRGHPMAKITWHCPPCNVEHAAELPKYLVPVFAIVAHASHEGHRENWAEVEDGQGAHVIGPVDAK